MTLSSHQILIWWGINSLAVVRVGCAAAAVWCAMQVGWWMRCRISIVAVVVVVVEHGGVCGTGQQVAASALASEAIHLARDAHRVYLELTSSSPPPSTTPTMEEDDVRRRIVDHIGEAERLSREAVLVVPENPRNRLRLAEALLLKAQVAKSGVAGVGAAADAADASEVEFVEAKQLALLLAGGSGAAVYEEACLGHGQLYVTRGHPFEAAKQLLIAGGGNRNLVAQEGMRGHLERWARYVEALNQRHAVLTTTPPMAVAVFASFPYGRGGDGAEDGTHPIIKALKKRDPEVNLRVYGFFDRQLCHEQGKDPDDPDWWSEQNRCGYSASALQRFRNDISPGWLPELVLVLDYGAIPFSNLCKSLFPSAIWALEAGDDPQHHKDNLRAAWRYDLVLTPHRPSIAEYRAHGIRGARWWPQFCDDDNLLQEEPPACPVHHDVVTTCNRGRGVIDEIGRRLEELHGVHLEHGHTPPGRLHHEFLSSGLIVLNQCSHGEVTRRVMEGAAAGRLVLTDALPEDVGIGELLRIGEEIVVYEPGDPDAAVKAIMHYLRDDEGRKEREEIAARARMRVLDEHTATARVDMLMVWAAELRGAEDVVGSWLAGGGGYLLSAAG